MAGSHFRTYNENQTRALCNAVAAYLGTLEDEQRAGIPDPERDGEVAELVPILRRLHRTLWPDQPAEDEQDKAEGEAA